MSLRDTDFRLRNVCKSLTDLQLRCVKSIISNFEVLMDEYHYGSTVPRRNFEFLQRFMSKELLQTLYLLGMLKEEYFPFLINRHLKELNLRLFSYSAPEVILDRLRSTGNGIRILKMIGENWSEENLAQLIPLIPNVESLEISGNECTNRILESIGRNCPMVSVLDITSCRTVTDEGIMSLCPADENSKREKNNVLHKLYLVGTGISYSGISFCLDHFPLLVVFEGRGIDEVIYKKYTESSENSDELPTYNLATLDINLKESCYLTGIRKSDISVEILNACSATCHGVTSFSIFGLRLESEFSAFSAFSKVEKVKLCNCAPPDGLTYFIRHGSTLRSVEIFDTGGCLLSET